MMEDEDPTLLCRRSLAEANLRYDEDFKRTDRDGDHRPIDANKDLDIWITNHNRSAGTIIIQYQ